MKMQNIKCPRCDQTNTTEFWDNNTKEELGVGDKSHYMSAGSSKKDHAEVESYYHCPICNEEVPGIDLIKD